MVTICTIICNNEDLLILLRNVFLYKSLNKYFYFPKHDLPAGLCNGYRRCSLWSTNWTFTCYIYTTVRPQAVFRGVHKIVRATIRFTVSVPLSSCNYSARSGRVFMKSDLWRFYANLSRKFKFHYKLTRKTCVQYLYNNVSLNSS